MKPARLLAAFASMAGIAAFLVLYGLELEASR
jgi:hypothetical protein